MVLEKGGARGEEGIASSLAGAVLLSQGCLAVSIVGQEQGIRRTISIDSAFVG